MQTENKAELSDSAAVALAHLGMLVQIAAGQHRAQLGEVEKRASALAAYIRTGQLLAVDIDRGLVEAMREYVKAQTPLEATG